MSFPEFGYNYGILLFCIIGISVIVCAVGIHYSKVSFVTISICVCTFGVVILCIYILTSAKMYDDNNLTTFEKVSIKQCIKSKFCDIRNYNEFIYDVISNREHSNIRYINDSFFLGERIALSNLENENDDQLKLSSFTEYKDNISVLNNSAYIITNSIYKELQECKKPFVHEAIRSPNNEVTKNMKIKNTELYINILQYIIVCERK